MHECSYCSYTTNKKYNLNRHIFSVHFEEFKREQIVINASQNVTSESQNVTLTFCCSACGKDFTTKRSLNRHYSVCTGKTNILECEYCKKMFANRCSLSRHRKICVNHIENHVIIPTGKHVVSLPEKDGSSLNVARDNYIIQGNVNNNTNNNTTINNTVNILTFPESEEDEKFQFVLDKITKACMKKLIRANTPEIGFNKFVGIVLSDPQNQILQKSGPNVSHSSIHVGDGKWELAYDNDIYPVFTHHMTCAALEKVNEYHTDIDFVKRLYDRLEPFRDFVKNINEDNESENYKDTIARIKLIIVNMTRTWMQQNKVSLERRS